MFPTEPNLPTTQPTPRSAGVTPATSGASCRPQRTSSLAVVTLVVLTLLLPLAGCSAVDAQLRGEPTGPAQQVTPSPAVAGKPSVQEIAQTTMLTSATTDTFSTTCPQGAFALGGGWAVPTQTRVFAAQVTGKTWTVSVSGYTGPITVTAYVECLVGVADAAVTWRETVDDMAPTPATLSNDQLGGVIATCAQDEVPVGFGFDFGSASAKLELEESWPRPAGAIPFVGVPGWVYRVRNDDSVSHQFSHSVGCLSNVKISPACPTFGVVSCYATLSTSYPLQQGASALLYGETATALVSCPSGTVLGGGGFLYERPDTGNQYTGNLYLLHATSTGWQSNVYAVTGYGLFALVPTAVAVCIGFS